jgi:ABC-type branched-subunit amino acid transport system substrate-binding protein
MKRTVLILGLMLACSAAVVGCGGSSSSSGSAGGATATNAGASSSGGGSSKQLVILESDYITSTNSTGHPEAIVGANLAADAINAAGGINGTKVKIVPCDTTGTIPGEVACAREAISDHADVAINNAEAPLEDYPIYRRGNIPEIVEVNGTDAVSQASQKGWAFATDGHSTAAFLDLPFYMRDHGLSKLAVIGVDLPLTDSFVKVLQVSAKKAGVSYVGTIKVPLTALTNPTAYADQVKTLGADTVLFFTGTPQATPIINAAQSLGVSNVKWMSNCLVYGVSDLEQVDPQQQGNFILGCPYPLPTESNYPIMQQYVAALKQHGEDTSANLRVEGVQNYMQVNAIAEIARQIKGSITSSSLEAAMENAKNVSIGGLYNWTPSQAGPPQLPLLSAGRVYWFTTENFPSTKTFTPVSATPSDLLSELG